MRMLQSFVADEWVTPEGDGTVLADAVTGEPVATASTAGIDMAAAVGHARRVGGPALRRMTFHERAAMLKALAAHLSDVKDELYDLSFATGATRKDAWVDVDGGIGVLFVYASKGRRELPNAHLLVDGDPEVLAKDGSFLGLHVLTPREGVAVHINAFNFPVWGMLEKLAPTLLAGMPAIVKPATQTSFVTEAAVRRMIESGILPPGALQFLAGSAGDLLDHLSGQDVVGFTGSAATAERLRAHPSVVRESVHFTAETDSLNSSILGSTSAPGTPEFDHFVTEVVREMTIKAGQRCTAIRRALVPASMIEAVEAAITEKLAKVRVGNPTNVEVTMGALASRGQLEEVQRAVAALRGESDLVTGDVLDLVDADPERGAFMAPTLLRSDGKGTAVHEVEAFGPVATLIPYEDTDHALDLVRRGGGSLVASVFTGDPAVARDLTLGIAAHHGRVLVVDERCGRTQTGHGSPMPHLVHGGPGRAGGGEELGGMRGVAHHMQRTALQGSPDMLMRIVGRYLPGATRDTSGEHPFKRHFEDVAIGDALETAGRTITLEDIERFADLTGDTFYAHMDEEAAKANPFFEGRVAHGYFVVSAAAGLFVWPDPGPVLANYGLENLRFVTPAYPGDTLRVILTCKDKSERAGAGYGEIRWDTEVLNQNDEVVATYDVLTLVASRP
jgi:oxepin-CoA hydrolase / 3-oxo-5,6-dehydrosuberyl-CoA semialdehyde dehydrogenase